MWYYWKSDSLRGRRGAADAGDSAWSSEFDVYPMRITQKMIADEAGVSQTTVSMVLRDRKSFACTPDVRAKVLDAARGLRYAVPRHRTHNLGLLVHLKQASSIRFDSYYNRFFHGLVERASTLGYHLLLESYEPSVWPPAIVASRKVDGLIVQIHLAPSHRTGQLAAQLPVVMLNTRGESDEVVSLMPDNAGGLAQSVRHLHALGHRRIAYFGLPGPPVGSLHNRERYEGYLAAMRTLGIGVDPELVRLFPVIPPPPDGLQAATDGVVAHYLGLREPPTAVLSNGDLFILAFMRAARQRDWRIPDQVSVIGFDNTQACLHSDPMLSSIEQPMEAMGAAAVDALVRSIAGEVPSPRQMRFPVELVLRASTAPCADPVPRSSRA